MYQENNDNWILEYYDHYREVPNSPKKKIEKIKLEFKNDLNIIWLNILKTNIPDLPNMADIDWKLRKDPEIIDIDGEKQLMWNQSHFLDGEGYTVQFKDDKKINQVRYGNPESYLRIYSNVDELIYFSDLLNLIRSEFEIWKI